MHTLQEYREELQEYREKYELEVKKSLAESVAGIAFYAPFTTLIETSEYVGMQDEVALEARLWGATSTFAVMPFIMRGRDFSQNYFGITEDTKERYKLLHDGLYLGSLAFIVKSGIYYLSDEPDIKKIILGAGLVTVASLALGPPGMWINDVFKDFVDLEETSRIPYKVQGWPNERKRKYAAGFIIGSLLATAAAFHHSPDTFDYSQDSQQEIVLRD